jgi:hypothetical protein
MYSTIKITEIATFNLNQHCHSNLSAISLPTAGSPPRPSSRPRSDGQWAVQVGGVGAAQVGGTGGAQAVRTGRWRRWAASAGRAGCGRRTGRPPKTPSPLDVAAAASDRCKGSVVVLWRIQGYELQRHMDKT